MSIEELHETARVCREQAALSVTPAVAATLRQMAEHYEARAEAIKGPNPQGDAVFPSSRVS